MAAINKTTTETSNSITMSIRDMISWIKSIISRWSRSNKTEEHKITQYYHNQDYDNKRYREMAQKRIQQAKYQARRNYIINR